MFKSLNGMAPIYLSEMLHYANFNHCIQLVEPNAKTSMGDRAFQKCGPRLWNNLPNNVKRCSELNEFKSVLKTHLFNIAHNVHT